MPFPVDGGAISACVLCGTTHLADVACRRAEATTEPAGLEDGEGRTRTLPSGTAATPSPAGLIGTMVGNFRIVRLLGSGGMGSVYLGEHKLIGSRVAIKFLHPHLAADPGLVDRFYAEARAANLIGHENVVSIFDIAHLPPNHHYLVMEFLEGETLAERGAAGLPPPVAIPILMQACDALGAAHARSVIHRDLKPENIFLVRRGSDENVVKLVDFGIAKILTSAAVTTMAGLMVGTPEFMAPEQWSGGEVDGRTDLYALGIIAYQLATGVLPFQEQNVIGYFNAHREQPPRPPRELNRSVPPAFERAILKALAKRPEDRFQSAAEFRAALAACLVEGETLVPPAPSSFRELPTEPALPAERLPAVEERPAPPKRDPTPPPAAPPRPTYELTAAWGGVTRQVEVVDVTGAGLYVCFDGPPPALMSRIEIRLPGVACEADVVTHVGPDQARAWGMPCGFGVQFARPSPRFKSSLEHLLKGSAPPPPAELPDDPVAALALERLRTRLNLDDPYLALELMQDADCGDARAKYRAVERSLADLGRRALSNAQREECRRLLARAREAAALLGNAERRAAFDAERGNHRGVARCLAAGLTVSALEELRRTFLTRHPGAAGRSHVMLVSANAYAANDELGQAVSVLEQALVQDPLNVELHRRHSALIRELGRRGKR